MKAGISKAIVLAVALGILALGEPMLQTAVQDGAYAQRSACYQHCRNVMNWPAAQCRRYCARRK